VQNESFSDATLVILGHGTELNAGSAEPAIQHAATLRGRNLFAAVREAFWKQEPQVKFVLASLTTPRVFIVPLFISEGYFSTQIIPKELGFHGVPSALRQAQATWYYCQPVGTHAHMTDVILARARKIIRQFPFPFAPKPTDTTLFIAGHGTERNANSRKAIEQQVALIRAQKIYAAVEAIFMEEDPRITDCHQLAPTKNIVVVPFFISDGLHVVEDIPVLLGEPEKQVKERLAAGRPTWQNPTEKHGKRIWYSPSVGTEPLLADVILERAQEAVVMSAQPAKN
jgi:sirohydrochlorin cobaltochelatase